MAYLKKKQYEFRANSAALKNATNEEIAIKNGMSEDAAQLITTLCSLRHELHSNIDSLVISDENNFMNRFIELNSQLNDYSMAMDFCPTDLSDYIDIDNFNILDEIGEEYERDEEYERIYQELSFFNYKIEKYLSEIDKKYGTNFAPTGALRMN